MFYELWLKLMVDNGENDLSPFFSGRLWPVIPRVGEVIGVMEGEFEVIGVRHLMEDNQPRILIELNVTIVEYNLAVKSDGWISESEFNIYNTN